MSFLSSDSPLRSRSNYATRASAIAYFESRLEATEAELAGTADEGTLASRERLAAGYRSKLAELSTGKKRTASAGMVLGQASETGVSRAANERAERSKLSLGWQRTDLVSTP
jgi:hypothetical protein